MIKDTFIIMKKEFLELKTSIIRLLPMSILVLLPLAVIAFDVGKLGPSLISKEMIVFLVPNILGGSIAYELTQNNIAHEKREKTLDILLVSDINKYSIVIGKIIPGVITGSIISFLGNFILCFNYDFRSITKIWNLILTPLLIYLINQISIFVSILIKDEKIGVFVGFLFMILSCTPIVMLKNRIFAFMISVLLVIILTVISAKLLKSV